MKIACLGWGSLIWDPRSVHIRSDWFSDGPLLPIEFARVSKDKRVTLVITPGSPLVRSLWALSSLDSVDAAKVDLALREGIKPEHVADKIGVWQLEKIDVNPEIVHWAKRLNLDAVLWTNLKPRFDGEERIATVDEIISHILHLSHEERSNAERYIRMAPKQIDTPYRRRMQQEFGWTPQASF
ncbi:MAG TPA: hypothetical protein VGN44_15215 [Candidatus Angelobacter sp.]|jgi:hypothetical protein